MTEQLLTCRIWPSPGCARHVEICRTQNCRFGLRADHRQLTACHVNGRTAGQSVEDSVSGWRAAVETFVGGNGSRESKLLRQLSGHRATEFMLLRTIPEQRDDAPGRLGVIYGRPSGEARDLSNRWAGRRVSAGRCTGCGVSFRGVTCIEVPSPMGSNQ